MLKLKLFLFTILGLFSALTAIGQETDSMISTKEEIAESVKLVPCDSKDRLEAVKKLFTQMGAKSEEIIVEKFDKDKTQNVTVKLKGQTDKTIVVGAHYDKTDSGCGAVDNWTGISIIAHLYKTFRQAQTEKSLIFVAFDREEEGLIGSAAMVKAIPKESRLNYCAMVNIDSFGLSTPFSLQQTTSPQMAELAKKVAAESKLKFADVFFAGADSDSSSFKKNKIPAITFSGLDNNWRNYLHSRNDQLEKINMASVYLGYRFILLYLAKLDTINCSELNK